MMRSLDFYRPFAASSLAALVFTTTASAQLGDDRPGDAPQRPPSADLHIPPAPVLSPAEALRSFILPPGFRIELVAAEPLVQDPVVVAFDPRGRMWVVEMSGYNHEIITRLPAYLDPSRPPPERPPGRIVRLEDTDGDGRMDRRTVYWDGLNMPRAVAFLGDRVLVMDPPHFWQTRDRDGDGVMDEKTLIAGDFGTPENVEGSPSGLLWGRDNWLYNASCNLRLRPLPDGSWRREPMPLFGHWGLTQDDFGRLFHNGNSDHLRGDFLPARYAAGIDPRLPFYGVNARIANDQSTWPARPTPGANRSYREGALREDGSLRAFTAASAPLIFRGTNFPPSFEGNAFVPEPAGNLVKRAILIETEGRLTALPAYHQAEFLASTDERFRPVSLANGPDGALYVADFYRGHIEGFQYSTTYLRDQVLQRGLNRPLWGLGRIYRVVAARGPQAVPPDFARADDATLVRLLTDENGWTRDTAQRLIVESGRAGFAPALRALMASGPKPRDRVSAIWCLESLGEFSLADARRAMTDADTRVRIAALQAIEPVLTSSASRELISWFGSRIADEEPIVLAQLALSLGGINQPAPRDLLWQILPRAAEHPALADSVLVALRGREAEVMTRLHQQLVTDRGLTFGSYALFESLGTHFVLSTEKNMAPLIAAMMDARIPQTHRLALLRGASKLPRVSLPEADLIRLAADAPDALVRRTATATLQAIGERKARIAARPAPLPLTPAQQVRFEAGREVYGLCAACHQPDGRGRIALAPPLDDGRWASAASADGAIRIMLHGKEGTAGFPAAMGPLASLGDEQLASVLTYIRRSWGNQASAVAPADVQKIRGETATRIRAWTESDLLRAVGEPN